MLFDQSAQRYVFVYRVVMERQVIRFAMVISGPFFEASGYSLSTFIRVDSVLISFLLALCSCRLVMSLPIGEYSVSINPPKHLLVFRISLREQGSLCSRGKWRTLVRSPIGINSTFSVYHVLDLLETTATPSHRSQSGSCSTKMAARILAWGQGGGGGCDLKQVNKMP